MNLQVKYNKINGKYKNKHSTKYYFKPLQKIIFVNIYSVKDDMLKFTNFFQRNNSTRIMNLKEIINNCIMNPSYFEKNFYGSEVTIEGAKNLKKFKRLYEIIKLYKNEENIPLNRLFKYKPNRRLKKKYGNEGGFQLIFSVKDDVVYVYLIDLYHLTILSKDNDLSLDYGRRKNYKKCMSAVLFDKTSIPN